MRLAQGQVWPLLAGGPHRHGRDDEGGRPREAGAGDGGSAHDEEARHRDVEARGGGEGEPRRGREALAGRPQGWSVSTPPPRDHARWWTHSRTVARWGA